MLKNQYESLIQQMIMDDIPWMTPELRTKIENAPIENRREMIIAIMEENNEEHRLMFSEIRKMMSNPNRTEMTHIKEVVQMLRKYVKVSEIDSKKYGEIMTPIELVEEMLDTLPHIVWTNPDLKWLDPCNGVGPFIAVIVERLMKGLKQSFPNEDERYKHIMENMIYVCERQAKNMFLYLYAFDPENKYALNIYYGSYLTVGFNTYMMSLGINKFNITVMNPPYNGNESNTASLWDKFVFKTVDDLIEGGYLVAVHPSSWRKSSGRFKDIQKLLRSRQISYLEIHDKNQGKKTFGVYTTYDFYCLQNVPCILPTKIKCVDGTTERVDISKMEYIPNGMFTLYSKLIPKNGEKTVKIISDSSYHTQRPHINNIQTDEFKYPVVYYTYLTRPTRFYYSNTNKLGHFGISKVIFTRGVSKPIIDEEGQYGVTHWAWAIVDDIDKLPHIHNALLNPEFIKLMSFADGENRQKYNWKMISTFRKDFWKITQDQ